MGFKNVISLLEEEKQAAAKDLKNMKKLHRKHSVVDSLVRKATGGMSYAEDVTMLENEIEEINEAIRILRIAGKDDSNANSEV